jgi:hypothetical protein
MAIQKKIRKKVKQKGTLHPTTGHVSAEGKERYGSTLSST